ncbi:hypothetical protein CBS115989_9480 [Aspergillus niger]|nr:hypothetical protein CBS115989_9480 [Aspergillus niger]KAI2837194.1 hypothetical protein CBS11232_9962 [Aspergillus niger]KAI2869357.1 hypothetical protein CBS115988_10112 [Aspergillus niger]
MIHALSETFPSCWLPKSPGRWQEPRCGPITTAASTAALLAVRLCRRPSCPGSAEADITPHRAIHIPTIYNLHSIPTDRNSNKNHKLDLTLTTSIKSPV